MKKLSALLIVVFCFSALSTSAFSLPWFKTTPKATVEVKSVTATPEVKPKPKVKIKHKKIILKTKKIVITQPKTKIATVESTPVK